MKPRYPLWFAVAPLAVAVVLLLWPTAPASSSDGYCITITVDQVRSAEGFVRVAVFADEESYLSQATHAAAAKIPAAEGAVETTLCGLEAGTYGVSVFHDLDDDEQLGTNRLGMPIEGFGFSGGVKARFGKPDFDKISFTLDADHPSHAVSIELQHLF